MASAVLASRNEPHWGEHKVYMRKYSNNSTSNPHLNRFNPNPKFISNLKANPNPSRQVHNSPNRPHAWHSHEPSPRTGPPAASNDARPSYRKSVALENHNEHARCRYVTFDLSVLSKGELKQLKTRLISELEQVRRLRNWIESRDVISRPPLPQLKHVPDSRLSVTAPSSRENQQCQPPEFATGEKKMLSPRCSSKKFSKKKRGFPFSSSGRDAKRPAVLMDSPVDKVMRRCRQILTALMKHKHGWVFNKPVDVVGLGLHDYNQIIKHPMDLGTVKSRVDNNEYRSPLDFAYDVRLTFNNAMTYNPKGQDVYVMAEILLARFETLFNSAYQKYETEHQRIVVPQQVNHKIRDSSASPIVLTSVLPEPTLIARRLDSTRIKPTSLNTPRTQVQNSTGLVSLLPSSPKSLALPPSSPKPVALPPSSPKPVPVPKSAKLPKPKAKDPHKRQMTFEEKAKLGVSLQEMPQEKMDQLVQIVRKRNLHLLQEGDEIELDIEVLDNETLWELDRFVCYHKKAMSKMIRQGALENCVPPADINKSPVSEAAVQKSKKGDCGEEDVDIGVESPVNNFPPVEIEKDNACASDHSSSSSGSSSSNDSSSSDSDSRSSSGSDSEDSVQSPCVD